MLNNAMTAKRSVNIQEMLTLSQKTLVDHINF